MTKQFKITIRTRDFDDILVEWEESFGWTLDAVNAYLRWIIENKKSITVKVDGKHITLPMEVLHKAIIIVDEIKND